MTIKTFPVFALSALFSCVAAPLFADSVIRNQAMSAPTIAEYFIEDEGVYVELEIGTAGVSHFRDLLPDKIYQGMGFGDRPRQARHDQFFSAQLALMADDTPLEGALVQIGPDQRNPRDPISGEVLTDSEAADPVIKARLFYAFNNRENIRKPGKLVFVAPQLPQEGPAVIGFVAYHKGVAVNDFRYLASGYTLRLDWEDPWYSAFNTRNLKRTYASAMSGFIYVEPFEVRKEIIVRPKDIQRFVDLGLEGKEEIPVAMQGDIKLKVAEFLQQHLPVRIDGVPRDGELERINFLARTLKSSRVIDPLEPLRIDEAILGTIFVYPQKTLPQEVTLDWDLWDARIQRIAVAAVDEAGPLPSFLQPDWRQLVWTNFLKNPTLPTLDVITRPAPIWQQWFYHLRIPAILLALACLGWMLLCQRRHRALSAPAATLIGSLLLSGSAWSLGKPPLSSGEQGDAVVGGLLRNIYRAFDRRDESDIYDVLERSVSGELLTDIYLETKRSLVLASQGGARAKVSEVAVESATLTASDQGGLVADTLWQVTGSVGHWGHVHQRKNRYQAELHLQPQQGQWKLVKMDIKHEERL